MDIPAALAVLQWIRFSLIPPFAVCLALCCVSACGAAQDTGPPAAVAAVLGDLTTLCSDAGGEPRAGDTVRRADLNADGLDEFVLFAGWFVCENAVGVLGDREKILVVFAGDGASEAFSDAVFDAKLESKDNATELWVTTSAERCGRPAARRFAEETFCERSIVPAAGTRFEYAPVTTVRIIE
jgi:hypothetical protein